MAVDRNTGDSDFSDIETITVTVEMGPMGSPHKKISTYDKSHLPSGKIYCNNSACTRQGIPLGDILQSTLKRMIQNKEEQADLYEKCRGVEHMGRGHTRDCLETTAVINIRITYKVSDKE